MDNDGTYNIINLTTEDIMALTIADTINVPTQLGEYQIQLCYGDITQVEEKMDMVMVSAFPGWWNIHVMITSPCKS